MGAKELLVYITQSEQSEIISIFESQGLTSKASKLIAFTLARWEKNYGIKWVVGRLKSLRSALLTNNTDGIKTHPDGTFWGPFRPISRLAKSSRRGAIRAHRMLSIYGRWEHQSPTEEDYRDFSRSVAFEGYTGSSFECSVTRKDLRIARRASRKSTFNLKLPSSDKRVPFLKKSESQTLPDEHYFVLLEQCPNLLGKHKKFIARHLYDVNEFDIHSYSGSFGEPGVVYPLTYDVVGQVVGLTADRGMKLRFIANPHRFLQMATSRLQDALARYLSSLPESLVFNQDEAVNWVTNQLRNGKVLNSLDLSSATDHFPFDLQVKLIRKLFPKLKEDIDLWEDICGCLWESPSGLTDIRYGKGQPMGTRPSFAAFTVSHIHFVRTLGGTSENFRVIGDDIVISDPDLAIRYRDEMSRLGVTINLRKSLLNDVKAEFAGRIIDRYGLWPAYKASPINISKDPLGMVRQYGETGLSLLPTSIRDMVWTFARLPNLGPPHTQDVNVLNDVSPETVLSLYEAKPDLYEFDEFIPEHSTFVRPVSPFEEAQREVAGFRGMIGVGNPKEVVEHVNAQPTGRRSDVLLSLERSLTLGTGLKSCFSEKKYPISFVRKVSRLVERDKDK